MRSPSFLPVLALFLLGFHPAAAQVAPPGGVTSEDLLEPAPAPQETQDPLAAKESAAEQAFAEGDLARALDLYRELGATHPVPAERSRLRVTAAWLLFQQGHPEDASKELAAALFQDPGYLPRAEIYSEEFLALFENAQRDAMLERQHTAERKLKQGNDALAAGDTGAARGLLEASLALVPGSPRAVFALAEVDLREQRTDAALAGFERVLALERGAPEKLPRELKAQALNNVGVIFFGREQFEDAVHALEESTSLAGGDSRAWFNLGLARQKLDLASAGLDALRRAHELDRRDAEIAGELGRAYSGAGRWMDAVAVLLEGTQAHPESAILWLELAEAQRGLGNLEGMTASFGKAIELDSANAQGAGFRAAMALAQSALTAKNFGQAVAAAEVAVRLRAEDGSAWALLGLSQQASGRLQEAASSLEKAVEVAPERADIAHNLGTVYLAQKRYPEAEMTFRRAVTLDPAATESAAALARLQAQRSGSSGAARTGMAARNAAGLPKTTKRDLGATLAAVDYSPLGIRGLLVQSVAAGSLAERAGLLVDDLVLRADGQPLTQVAALLALLENPRASAIGLSILRAGKPVAVELRLR